MNALAVRKTVVGKGKLRIGAVMVPRGEKKYLADGRSGRVIAALARRQHGRDGAEDVLRAPAGDANGQSVLWPRPV